MPSAMIATRGGLALAAEGQARKLWTAHLPGKAVAGA